MNYMGPKLDFRQKVIGGWSWKSTQLSMSWQGNLRLVTGTAIFWWS